MSRHQTEQVKQFGANLRRERTKIGMSQEKLAELADLNIRTVQKIEAGDITILITTLLRLRHALKCEWESLLPKR